MQEAPPVPSPLPAVTEEELSASVPGGDLFVKRWSPSERRGLTPVVLFHDSIGCVQMWRQFPAALASSLGREVIAYDRLGYGRSSARRSLPSLDFVSDEAALYFRAVKAEIALGRFIAFGHSIGGAMAVASAVCFPQDCQLIITEAAQAFVELRTIHAIAAAGQKFQRPEELAKLAHYHGAKAEWVVRAWVDTWLSEGWASWSLEQVLPEVACPLLALHGEHDEYGSIAFPEMLASRVAGMAQWVIVPDCAHVPHREQEHFVLDLVSSFVDGRNIP